MTFPSAGQGASENIRIRLIADLQQYMESFEQAGRPIENLTAILQGVANQTGVMGETAVRTIQQINDNWQLQQDILEENREEIIAIQQILSEGVRRDPSFTSQERLNVLREENRLNQEFNRALDEITAEYNTMLAAQQRGVNLTQQQLAWMAQLLQVIQSYSKREVFKPENITAGAKEFDNLTKRVAVFGEQSGEVWETFAGQLGTAQERAKSFRIQVDLIKEQIIGMREAGQPLDDLKHGFREVAGESRFISERVLSKAFSELANEERKADAALKEYLNTIERTGQAWGDQPLRQSAEQARGFAGALQNLNMIAKTFFGISLFTIAQRALNIVINLFREATKAGVEWSRTLFNMSTSVRALQRTGVNITISEMNEQVQKLAKTFKFFTTRQLQEGISQIALLTRNVGLTKDEIFALSEATATLAIITGKDFAEQGLLVARSIASGYTEALQRAGIAANRLAIQEKAMRMGINKSFMQMTEQERAAVTLELVLEQVAAVSQDVGEFQNTMAGKMQTATVAMQEQTDELGRTLVPFAVFFANLKAMSVAFVNQFIFFVAWGVSVIGALLGTPFIALVITLKAIADGQLEEFRKNWGGTVELFAQVFQDTMAVVQNMLHEGMGSDLTEDLVGSMPLADSIREEAEEAEDNLEQGMKKMMDIVLDYHRAMEDAWTDHQDKVQDIMTKFDRDIEKLEISYQAKIQEINRETGDKIAQANEKFRLNELKAEENFLEKMTQLREKLIFDLEDAVRERDARQVLKLIRAFNLQKTQMTREEELARMQREREFQAELSDIARQRAIRLRELEVETEARRLALARRAEQELADNDLHYERAKRDIETRRRRRLDDLKSEFKHEMQIRLDHSAEVLLLAADTADKFREIWAQTFGIVGDMFGDLKIPVVRFTSDTTVKSPYNGKPRATGGTVVARRPTTVLMGERGAEAATFVPLNRIGTDQNRIFGGNLPGTNRGNGSQSLVRIMLAEGLRADIVRQAMDQTAEVIIEEMRK